VAPLAVAADAIYVNTTGMTIADVVDRVMGIVRDKARAPRAG
jgi:cytidylate kinase